MVVAIDLQIMIVYIDSAMERGILLQQKSKKPQLIRCGVFWY